MAPRYKVTVCGFGLIGGSIALDLLALRPRPIIHAFDQSRVLLAVGKDARFPVQTERDWHRAVDGCDILILSAPPKANRALLALAGKNKSLRNCLIIDVGSAKSSICTLGKKLSFAEGTQFVGCHPMAGTEKSGFQNAEKGMFRGNPWFVDSGIRLTKTNKAKLIWLASALRAQVVSISPENHDQMVAAISHLPQILSTLLASQFPPKVLQLAGPGLKSLLRLAGSPYSLWSDIIEENRQEIVDALTIYRDNLSTIISQMKKKQSLKPVFDSAVRSYRCLS
ncbi:MAG: prephenate dehydrogenase/arogenate dehydrogenase family protein [Candidatus Zixiibacteriota bacterium]